MSGSVRSSRHEGDSQRAGRAPAVAAPAIEISGLTKRYGEGDAAVDALKRGLARLE